jgi:anti-sigma B factor antagonist
MSVKLNIRHVGQVTVIDVSGRLTLGEGAGAIREEISDLQTGGTRRLLMNLAEVSYIDSSGIGELVADFTSLQSAGGALKLLGLTKAAKELLRVTKLSSMFEVFDDEADAVRSFN